MSEINLESNVKNKIIDLIIQTSIYTFYGVSHD